MIDLFDLKKGEAKYYDKPQRFYVVRNNTNVPRITIKETYAVWRRKTQNKVWFQSKYNRFIEKVGKIIECEKKIGREPLKGYEFSIVKDQK